MPFPVFPHRISWYPYCNAEKAAKLLHLDCYTLSLPALLLGICKTLFINKILHNIMQCVISPRNQEHILCFDRRPTRMSCEALQILCHVLYPAAERCQKMDYSMIY